MSLRQLGKDVQAFIRKSYEYHVKYKEQEAELLEQHKREVIGSEGLRQKLDEVKDEINERKHAIADELGVRVDRVHEQELKHIEDTTETVTADNVAELELISQLELTTDELNKYIDRYRRTPLALKKLQEIASTNNIIGGEFPRDRKQYLNTILGRMRTQINEFAYMQYGEMSIKVQMYMDGAIRSIDEDIAMYESL